VPSRASAQRVIQESRINRMLEVAGQMIEPIKAGDKAIVINGLGRNKSPNIGKQVTVLKAIGEHSQYGRVWRCEGAGIAQLTDSGTYDITGWADIPAAWLQKIKPTDVIKTKTKETETEK
jgi:hypothetical protein